MAQKTETTQMGANRTGLQTSPLHAKKMREIEALAPSQPPKDGHALLETRRDYILESEGLGSLPPPTTVKGVLKSGAKMLSGHRPQVFIDKLAERLAFERGGTRLYEAVIAKCAAGNAESLPDEAMAELQRFRDEEAEHALLVKECIEQLGADPTAQTPSADLVGMETLGMLQAASDPRTTLTQTLHVALAAELVDEAGWEILISAAAALGHDEMADRFRTALEQEAIHLATIRGWYEVLTLGTSESLEAEPQGRGRGAARRLSR